MSFKAGLTGIANRFEPYRKHWPLVVAALVMTAALAGSLAAARGTHVDAATSPSDTTAIPATATARSGGENATGVAMDAESPSVGVTVAAGVVTTVESEAAAMGATMDADSDSVATLTAAHPVSGPECGPGEAATGATLMVAATALNVRVGPGATFERLVNAQASQASGRTVYVQLNRPAEVLEMCRNSGWSQVQVGEPFAVTGWVANRFLEAQ